MPEFIPVSEPLLGEEELKNVIECVKSGWISSSGSFVSEFENEFAKFCGTKYGVSTTSGTTALHLALASLGIKEGDEVITSTFTNIATINSIIYCGAKPVVIDSGPDTWNMDVSKIEENITDSAKAILPVHIFGHMCDMDEIVKIAEEKNLFVVEDAAEVHGALYKGKKAGSIGDVGCFSFFGNKIITTGEGGMVVTDNEKLSERARYLKNLAFDKGRTYIHNDLGFNYRMTNIQAAIGIAQLKKIEKNLLAKDMVRKTYDEILQNVKGISTQATREWETPVLWMYPILIEKEFGLTRDEVRKKLLAAGIDTRLLFAPMHMQPFLKKYKPNYCPVAEELYKKGLYLPSGLTLSREKIEFICSTIKSLK